MHVLRMGRSCEVTPWLIAVAAVTLASAVCPPPSGAGPLSREIDNVEEALRCARAYRRDYPYEDNDPDRLRRRFLGADGGDGECLRPGSVPGHVLEAIVGDLVRLSWDSTAQDDGKRIDDLLNQAVQLSVEGWSISGNVSLLQALRTSYPRVASSGPLPGPVAEPVCDHVHGSLEGEFDFLAVDDAGCATLFYDEGTRALLASLRRKPVDGRPLIVDLAGRIPPAMSKLTGYFDNAGFPQYTYFVDQGGPNESGDDRIVPIQTQGHLMGHLLDRQGQAVQAGGQRLWAGAYFGSQVGQSGTESNGRNRLLGAAVNELRTAANAQFLASIALAATVRDDSAAPTEHTPFERNGLHRVRSNVQAAREAILEIRRGGQPIRPIDDVFFGDSQRDRVLSALNGNDTVSGSLARARGLYLAATERLREVDAAAQQAFSSEQMRHRYISDLEGLTGVAVHDSAIAIGTYAGQERFRELVNTRLDRLMRDELIGGSISNRLDAEVRQVRAIKRAIELKEEEIQGYDRRIEAVENALTRDTNAVEESGRIVSFARRAHALATSETVTVNAGVSVGSGFNFSAGVTLTSNPWVADAVDALQDIVRATTEQDVRLRESSALVRITDLTEALRVAVAQRDGQFEELREQEHVVNQVLGDVDRKLRELRAYDTGESRLWYNDPALHTMLTTEEEAANREIGAVVANLYKLGRILEKRWLEPFGNVVRTSAGPLPLGGGRSEYDAFSSLESVFALPFVDIRDRGQVSPVDGAGHFRDALMAWDAALCDARGDADGSSFTVEISLRQDVFGFADLREGVDGRPVLLDGVGDEGMRRRNLQRFQDVLIRNGIYMPRFTEPKGFVLDFALSHDQPGYSNDKRGLEPLFDDLRAWNHRVAQIEVMVEREDGGSSAMSTESGTFFYIMQTGTVGRLDYQQARRGPEDQRAESYDLSRFVDYDASDLRRSRAAPTLLPRAAVLSDSWLRDGDLGEEPMKVGGRYLSPFASKWLLQIGPDVNLEIQNIRDVWIRMLVASGRPGCLE